MKWSPLCSKNEYTKSESNSQPQRRWWTKESHCVQRTNIQNLKAIHNASADDHPAYRIVFKERIYKIWKQFTTPCAATDARPELCSKNEYTKSESNSQHIARLCEWSEDCVQRTNIQNLKAIHNVQTNESECLLIVFKERIYKIWKQFTTGCLR